MKTQEEKVFDKLKQTPLDEMCVLLENIVRPPIMFPLSNGVYDRSNYYHDMTFVIDKINLLKQHGWAVEDFQLELERTAILGIINDFNDSLQFPQEIVDRAKKFFPNIVIRPATVDLGE